MDIYLPTVTNIFTLCMSNFVVDFYNIDFSDGRLINFENVIAATHGESSYEEEAAKVMFFNSVTFLSYFSGQEYML